MDAADVSVARVLFFCQVYPRQKHPTWGDIGFDYLKNLYEAKLPVRAISSIPTGFSMAEEPWDSVSELFHVPIPHVDDNKYINVVCSFGDDFRRFHREGVLNIAITGCFPRAPNDVECMQLRKYDRVWAIAAQDAVRLRELGLKNVEYVPAQPPLRLIALLKSALEGLGV